MPKPGTRGHLLWADWIAKRRAERKPVTCGHPEAPYGGRGRCLSCYNRWYNTEGGRAVVQAERATRRVEKKKA